MGKNNWGGEILYPILIEEENSKDKPIFPIFKHSIFFYCKSVIPNNKQMIEKVPKKMISPFLFAIHFEL